jgi:tetratricopeptide (TPR) repeat protein
MLLEKFQKTWVAWLFICAVTIAIYSGTLSYGILNNYDDDAYFSDSRISQLNAAHVKEYFSDYYLGMYQPVPVLSFAAVNSIFPGSAKTQRILQILLHCLNALLVLILVRRLSGNFWVGFLTALFFAIHPMQVESVSWLATRSNLLYSFFFLLALILYMEWQDGRRWWQWGLMFLCFAFSLFSKVTAATFPLAVILLDWFRGKKFSSSTLLPYLPLVLLSVIFIRIGIHASGAFGHITELGQTYSFPERIMILLQALWLYLVKAIVPFNQSVIYLYPWKESGTLPVSYFITGIIALLLIITLLVTGWILRKKESGKAMLLWLLFFLVTISIVLPLKWSRTVLIAERYTYIPYIGLFAGIMTMIFQIIKKTGRSYRFVLFAILGAGAIIFSLLSWNRNKVWKDPVTLFSDVIEKNRSGAEVSMGFYNRGNEYLRLKQPDKAISDYTRALKIFPGYTDAFYNRGLAYFNNGHYPDAINDFTSAISLKGDYPDAWINRANAYRAAGDYMSALNDLDHVIAIYHDKLAYFNRGVLYYFNFNNADQACSDWDEALRLGFKPAWGMLEKYCR